MTRTSFALAVALALVFTGCGVDIPREGPPTTDHDPEPEYAPGEVGAPCEPPSIEGAECSSWEGITVCHTTVVVVFGDGPARVYDLRVIIDDETGMVTQYGRLGPATPGRPDDLSIDIVHCNQEGRIKKIDPGLYVVG